MGQYERVHDQFRHTFTFCDTYHVTFPLHKLITRLLILSATDVILFPPQTMSFSGKKFRSRREQLAYEASLAGRYQKRLNKNPFLYFGLPFCSMIILGSYWLSGFTAVRYQQKDRKIQELSEEDLIKMKTNKRDFDIKEEYYRLQGLGEDWEPKRVPRFEGESENVW